MFFILLAFFFWIALWLLIGAAAGAIGFAIGFLTFRNKQDRGRKSIWIALSCGATTMICFLSLTIGSLVQSVICNGQETSYWPILLLILVSLLICILLSLFFWKKFFMGTEGRFWRSPIP